MKLITPLVRNQTGIYCITNTLNGMKYIGRASCLLTRWSQHRRAYNQNQPIARAVQEQGTENFIFEVLEFCDYESTFERESFYIERENSMWPTGYNACAKDSLPNLNKPKPITPETSSNLPYTPARKR